MMIMMIRAAANPSMGCCCCELTASAADATNCGLDHATTAQDVHVTASAISRTAAAAVGCSGSVLGYNAPLLLLLWAKLKQC